MNGSAEIIASIVGGAGFAGLIAWVMIQFLMKFIHRQQQTIENHISEDTKAKVQMAEAIRELTSYIRGRDEKLGR